MKKEIIKIAGLASPPSPFSHVVKAGNFIFLSSQLSTDLKTNKIIGGNIAEQTKRALENIKFLLESSGTTMEDVVKVTVYLRSSGDFENMNAIYRNYFKKGAESARVTIQAASPIKGIDIEIDAVAVIP